MNGFYVLNLNAIFAHNLYKSVKHYWKNKYASVVEFILRWYRAHVIHACLIFTYMQNVYQEMQHRGHSVQAGIYRIAPILECNVIFYSK